MGDCLQSNLAISGTWAACQKGNMEAVKHQLIYKIFKNLKKRWHHMIANKNVQYNCNRCGELSHKLTYKIIRVLWIPVGLLRATVLPTTSLNKRLSLSFTICTSRWLVEFGKAEQLEATKGVTHNSSILECVLSTYTFTGNIIREV